MVEDDLLSNQNNYHDDNELIKLLNEYKLSDRPNTFIKSEFLNVVIHYELKNHNLVLKKDWSTKRRPSRRCKTIASPLIIK